MRSEETGEPLLRTYDRPTGQPLPPGKFVVLRRPGEHADAFHGVGLARRRYRPAGPERIRLPESLRGVEPTPSLPDDTPPGAVN